MTVVADKTRELEDARKKLKDALNGLSDETFNKEPGPEDWSPKQITQHLAEVESRLAFAISRTRNQEWNYGREEPAFSNATEALAGLGESRRRLIESVHGVDDDAFNQEQEGRQGPYSIGSLVDVQIHHDQDHAQQIAALR